MSNFQFPSLVFVNELHYLYLLCTASAAAGKQSRRWFSRIALVASILVYTAALLLVAGVVA